jgi:uncharacterized protein DUF2154
MASNPNLSPGSGSYPPPLPARPFVWPVILIIVGVLFLCARWQPGFSAWRVIFLYWPLILIFWGMGKIWDNSRQRGTAQGQATGLIVGVMAFVLIISVLLWRGHSFSRAAERRGEMRQTSTVIEPGKAKSVHARIEMHSGELNIDGGGVHLLDARFDQKENAGDPQVEYSENGDEGDLRVWADSSEPQIGFPSHGDNRWDLKFGSGSSLTLRVDMGAGQGNLHLNGLPVTRMDLHLGAGQMNVDLTGTRKEDLTGEIDGGVGEAQIRLPRNVGVMVEAHGGIGSIDTHGLHKDGGQWVNDAYGKSPSTIRLKVQGGIGRIALNEE